MAKTTAREFKVGDIVKLKPSVAKGWKCPEGRVDDNTAVIKVLLSDVEGGLMMSSDLHGCLYWNVNDVMHKGGVKSRFQLINRGRKGKPCWTVEDYNDQPRNSAIGKHMYSNRSKSIAEGYMMTLRDLERKEKAAAKVAQ